MKTEKEILDRIQEKIKSGWKYGNKESRKLDRVYCNALCWTLYGYSYKEVCPYCGSIMECDTVNVGIGYQQCGPYHCEECGASEIHPNDSLELDEDEKETGYYKNRISPLANTCCGQLVNHETAKFLYERGCLDNCKPSYFIGENQ